MVQSAAQGNQVGLFMLVISLQPNFGRQSEGVFFGNGI